MSLSLSFEEALEQLDKIVKQLEEGKVSLDESMKIFEQGQILKKYCLEKIDHAIMKIEQISVKDHGQN